MVGININSRFAEWFDSSVVKNSDGSARVMYYACSAPFSIFTLPSVHGQIGFRFESKTLAEARNKKELMLVYLSVKSPLLVAEKEFWCRPSEYLEDLLKQNKITKEEYKADFRFLTAREQEIEKRYDSEDAASMELADLAREYLASKGVDGLIYLGDDGLSQSVYAFYPTQIKSVHNKGHFNPNNPDIMA